MLRNCLCLLLFCLGSHALAADSVKKHQQTLQHLNKQITSTQSSISSSTKKRHQLQQQLQQTETAIGRLAKTIATYDKQIATLNQQLRKLQNQQNQLDARIQTQRQALSEQLRSAYRNQQENSLKVLLNQQDAGQVNRMMTYYQYYNQARLALIDDVNENLQQLHQIEQSAQEKTVSTQQLRGQRIAQQKKLQTTERERKQVITALGRSISSKQQRLSQLQQDKRNLEALITRLKNSAAIAGNQPFNRLKGKLDWPLKGRVLRNFGSKENNQSLPLQGILLAGGSGQMIQAVARGKVVYADWLRGFGLLLIVDHGQGYMTLYAHCKSLFKKVNEMIEPGTFIASVGNSGGLPETALLFQIRHKGIPQNPRRWLR